MISLRLKRKYGEMFIWHNKQLHSNTSPSNTYRFEAEKRKRNWSILGQRNMMTTTSNNNDNNDNDNNNNNNTSISRSVSMVAKNAPAKTREALLALRLRLNKTNLENTVFSVLQYNILASTYGRNTQPWFLHGIDISQETRKQIFQKFYARDEEGRLLNRGWPNYVRGILTPQEISTVEQIDRDCFQWEDRFERILDRIETLDVDIVSLVELDRYEELRARTSILGYSSRFVKRPKQKSLDGCCILWRRSKFSLNALSSVYLPDEIDPKTGEPVLDRCCIMVILETKDESSLEDGVDFIEEQRGQSIVVVSMHLARNPEKDSKDVLRGSQLAHVIDHLNKFMTKHGVEEAPVVCCGDVNALNFSRLKGIASVAAIFSKSMSQFVSPFGLHAAPTNETTYTKLRSMRIDAILFQTSQLDLLASGTVEDSQNKDSLPNLVQPSDHVPIKATMRIKTFQEQSRHLALQWYWSTCLQGAATIPEIEMLDEPMHLGPSKLLRAFEFYLMKEPGWHQSHREIISVSGLKDTLLTLGIYDCKRPVNELRNRRSSLNFAEFCSEYFNGYVKAKTGLDVVFEAIDLNKDGIIDIKEFRFFLSSFKGTSFQVGPEDLNEILDFCTTYFPSTLKNRVGIDDDEKTKHGKLLPSIDEWYLHSKDVFKRFVVSRYVQLAGFPQHVEETILQGLVERYELHNKSKVSSLSSGNKSINKSELM